MAASKMSHIHGEMISFFSRLLPETPPLESLCSASPSFSRSKVPEPLVYHVPKRLPHSGCDERGTCSTTKLVFSLTATPGVYHALASSEANISRESQSGPTLFLHRPWDLIRWKLPDGVLVLQSHRRFDELYTTGFNEAFAKRHFVDSDNAVCLKGLKGDSGRRIGLIGPLRSRLVSPLSSAEQHTSPARAASLLQWTAASYAELVCNSFHGYEAVVFHGDPKRKINTVASLNALTPEIISRVLQADETLYEPRKSEQVAEHTLTSSQEASVSTKCGSSGSHILVITGAAAGREDGMDAARRAGIAVVAVGHRRSEMWGLRYIAEKAKEEFHGRIDVTIVDEEAEERMERERRKRTQRRNLKKQGPTRIPENETGRQIKRA